VQRQPPGGETGARNSRLLMRLLAWPGALAGPHPRGLTALRRKMAAYQANGAHLGCVESDSLG